MTDQKMLTGKISEKRCQVTDTSAINMFLSDEAFSKIVLGGNYFRINRSLARERKTFIKL